MFRYDVCRYGGFFIGGEKCMSIRWKNLYMYVHVCQRPSIRISVIAEYRVSNHVVSQEFDLNTK